MGRVSDVIFKRAYSCSDYGLRDVSVEGTLVVRVRPFCMGRKKLRAGTERGGAI